MDKQDGWIASALVIIAILAIVGGIIAFNVHWSTNHHDVAFTVNKSERVCSDTGKGTSCKYLVYTDAGIYQDTDSLLNGKFNSSDLYNNLQSGKRYTCDAVGFRNGFFSAYENLLTCKEAQR